MSEMAKVQPAAGQNPVPMEAENEKSAPSQSPSKDDGDPLKKSALQSSWETRKQMLLSSDLSAALSVVSELRERMEIVHSSEFPFVLHHLLPAMGSLLKTRTRVNLDPASLEHMLRHKVLELVSRFPHNEALRPYALSLAKLSLEVLGVQQDVEENAMLANRIYFDLQKNYRHMLDETVQPYLDICLHSYRQFPLSVQRNFTLSAASAPTPAPTAPATITTDQKTAPAESASALTSASAAAAASAPTLTPPPLRSTFSFRVLTEFPLTIMMLLQCYPKYIRTTIPTLVQLMVEVLTLRAQPMAEPSSKGAGKQDPTWKLHVQRTRELVAAQVKALSFLIYLLRGYSELMRPHEFTLAAGVIGLLQVTCHPPHMVPATRRELLVAVRHILATEYFAKAFYRHLDTLLDEQILLGSSSSSSCISTPSLRTLGYGTLADLVHHVRNRLTMTQLGHVVEIFGRVLHDTSMVGTSHHGTNSHHAILLHHVGEESSSDDENHALKVLEETSLTPWGLQVTSVRLLLNLVDHIFHNKDPNGQLGRDLLARIFHMIVYKFYSLKIHIQNLMSLHDSNTKSGAEPGIADPAKGETKKEEQEFDGMRNDDVANALLADRIRDVRALVKPMVLGLKTVIWCINSYRHQQEKVKASMESSTPTPDKNVGNNEEVFSASMKMTATERDLVDKYLKWCPPCLELFRDIYSSTAPEANGSSTIIAAASSAKNNDYREILISFAASLTVLDSYNFRLTVGRTIPELLDQIVKDRDSMVIPRHLLTSSQTVSYDFCDIFLAYLVDQMDALSTTRQEHVTYICTRDKHDKIDFSNTDPLPSEVQLPAEISSGDKSNEQRASALLELFELVFHSMSLFSENEARIRRHIQVIVATCLRSATEAQDGWPGNHYLLLRALFRCTSGGKFEDSYKELLPLLPTILNGLYRIYAATEEQTLRYTIIELCLTIPARLSSLLPHLPLLLRIIIPALQANSGELVNLGLRTLEFWVDNLNPGFLYPVLSQQTSVLTELMVSLTNHLRPAPYPYGLLTLRLLGKLGGKNRRFLCEPINVKVRHENGTGSPVLAIECAWKQAKVDECINSMNQSSGKDGSKDCETHVDSGNEEVKQEDTEMELESKPNKSAVIIECKDSEDDLFILPLPLDRAVDVLKLVASSEQLPVPSKVQNSCEDDASIEKTSLEVISWESSEKLLTCKAEAVDFQRYCIDVMEKTKSHQAAAALTILRSSLATLLEIEEGHVGTTPSNVFQLVNSGGASDLPVTESEFDIKKKLPPLSEVEEKRNETIQRICEGLIYGSVVPSIQEEAWLLLKGLVTHLFLITVSQCVHIKRIDVCGHVYIGETKESMNAVSTNKEDGEDQEETESTPPVSLKREEPVILVNDNPFGSFRLSGPLMGKVSPFMVNGALVDCLCSRLKKTRDNAMDVIAHLFRLSKMENPMNETLGGGAGLFFENLLSQLCSACLAMPWNLRKGALRGIEKLLDSAGRKWAMTYEGEIMKTALFVLKDSPQEISCAATEGFLFYSRICWTLYGGPNEWKESNTLIYDVLCMQSRTEPPSEEQTQDSADTEKERLEYATGVASEAVMTNLVSELASSKHLVRFTVRHTFCQLQLASNTKSPLALELVLKKYLSVIKKMIFSKPLRSLPLPEQVGVVEALTFIINGAPNLFTLSDQYLVAFLFELIQAFAIADGEMKDSNPSGVFVDKNGLVASVNEPQRPSTGISKYSSLTHASKIFLRRECVVDGPHGTRIVVPEELPYGIQLRVSALVLFRVVIRRHTSIFFDALPSTQIGNIRPHVISLFFRSLISNPPQAVSAAYSALRDVMRLEVPNPSLSVSHRIPKELLQTCVKPVLLNFREYTTLTVPLLRGLSRLLSLLSSLFNKTLGEKLLDHLQKWTDPDRIIDHGRWKQGEEPLVAVAIINLFELLPKAPHFVEPLIKTTIKLEAALPRFRTCYAYSPYRAPLARYLNKHPQYVVSFFLNEQRFKNPLYSEVFQDILKRDDTPDLRAYLGGQECTLTLLNVCFERQLGIIRAEKAMSSTSQSGTKSGPRSDAERLHMHGIRSAATEPSQRKKEIAVRQDAELKHKKLLMMQKEERRTKELLEARLKTVDASSFSGDSQASIQNVRRQHQLAHSACELGQKEYNDAKQLYSEEIAKGGASKDAGNDVVNQSTREMTIESLELQHQGLKLVETLMSKNKHYLKEHSDVVRTLRWLFRSKGRQLRLMHQESIPHRFHEESKLLGFVVVTYAENYPNDTDVLFDLLRIFLLPSATDFSFVRSFLNRMISDILTVKQKRHIIQRFFFLLNSGGGEDTKVLSIQFILLPILMSEFKARKKDDSSCEVRSARELNPAEEGKVREEMTHPIDEKEVETERAEAKNDQDILLDGQLIRKFVNEALLDGGGGARHYGDKLNIELLRVLNILLEYSGEDLVDHWKDLIKFSWNLLKSEDTKMKNLAYVNVCRFISVFDTPAKIILQVYSALLRSYQQESKDLVRVALDILVPALPLRLADDDFSKAMRYTRKIIYEEGNSIPQLAHIWQTIVRNSKIFVSYHHYYFSPMVNSLTRLGLPPNCPQENKSLALSIVDLVLCWDDNLTEISENSSIIDDGRKRKIISSAMQSEDSHLTKKIRLDKGVSAGTGQSSVGKDLKLDQTMKDTIINFLIRINLLVAESKGDTSSHNSLAERALNLFKKGLFRWSGKCTIQAAYFDKVLSMCQNEPSVFSETEPQAYYEKKAKDGKSKGKARNKASSKSNNTTKSTTPSGSSTHTKSTEEVKFVSSSLLVACLDIFIAILEGASHNTFLLDNSPLVVSILSSCFARASKLEYGNIRIRLEKFLKHTFSVRRVLTEHALSSIRLLMERSILESTFSVGHIHGTEGETTTKKAPSGILEKLVPNRIGGDCSALFILRVIEHAYLINVEFIEQFTGCLLSLAQKLAKEHLREAALNGRVTTPKMQQKGVAAFRQVQATPVLGILHQACGDSFTRGSPVASGTKKKIVDDGVSRSLKNVTELGSSFCSLIVCLRLVSSSSLPYSFTESRQNLLHIISNILDTSDNIQVILTCIVIIGGWLLEKGSGGPLTMKERNTFMRKINSFDSRGLPEVAVQPLSDIVSHIAVALQGATMKEVGKTMKVDVMQTAAETVEFSSKPSESNQIVLDRLLVSCLMSANPSIRSLLISKYAGPSLDCSLLSAGISVRSALEVLWHFLHSDFEGLNGRFWLVIFIEMMLTSSSQGSGLRLTSDCLASDFKTCDKTSTWTHESSSYWLPFPTRSSKVVTDVQTKADHTSTVNTNYIDFCKIICAAKIESNVGQGGCVTAIISLAHGDVDLSQWLFQKLLSSAWNSVHHDSVRLGLIAGLEKLLSQPFHSQFLKCEIKSSSIETADSGDPRDTLAVNVVKSLLRSIVQLNPMPVLDPDLLIGLAADYNAWHEVLTILEAYSDALDDATPDITVEKYKERIVAMIRHCYEHLGESDISAVLASKLCNLPQTKRSISLDMYGYVKEALSSYTSLVYQDGTTDNDLIVTASDFEVSFWEKRWIGLQKEMGQWPVISEYAEASGDSHLMMESAWKSRDWEKVRSLWTTPSIMAALEGGDPQIKMSEIFLAIAEGKLAEVENLHAQTAQLCLYKWQLLPSISTGCNAHVSLMQDFHRLVELRESGQIMVETSTHASGRTYPDLKNLLSAWRQRLPNEFEPLSVWEDLFLWRSHMFSAITSNFHWSEPGTLATLHDRPWTAIQMARTARKQGMKEVALLSLNRLTDCAMDVSDAFSKLREQIMAYHNSESELERTGGLNLINTTNLSFFDDSQKGELFRLKASFLQSLGGRSKANQAYCHAVQICPSYAKGWVSWGGLCKSLADLTAKQSETSVGSEASKDVSPSSSSAKKVSQYLAQAMGCYLEAIQCAGDDKSRVHLAKCLWMLTKDGSSPGVLCQTLETRGALLPSWIWLPWIPQLLSSLYRVEACAVKAILAKIVKKHPQSLYFSLRAFYLERRDIDRSQNPESPSISQQPNKIPSAVTHSEELMTSLRRDHYTLWTSLEAILDELIVSFRPSYEEEFLATITALLQRVESQTKHPQKGQTGEGDSVVASFFKTISKIASKYFRADTANTKDGKAKKTSEFRRRYKEDFEADFSIQDQEDSGVSHLSLEEVALRLNKWKNLLLVQVSAIPSHIPMQQLSSNLSFFCGEAPDLWSGACDSINSSSLLSSRDRHSESDAGQTHSSPSSSASAASRAAEAAASAVKMGAAHEGGGHCGGGSDLVEIPGQYVPNDTNALDTEPRPELHAKLIRFEPTIQIIRRNDQLIRRIGMVGSDGKVYHFLLQFGIPYWTRTDERTAQLHYLTGKILGRGRMSSRRYLSVKSTAVIPIAQRLRMTADDTSDTSLDDVFRRISDLECVDEIYQEEEGKLLKEKKSDNLPEDKQTELERSVKLQVFQSVCKMVKSDLLLNHMRATLDGPEQLFQFRRSFTTQLAANSLMQYVFAVVERTPSKFIFNVQNGRVLAPDFRFAYNKQGFLEGNEMPFRLTRNIRKLIGPLLIDGIFIPSMVSMASSMSDSSDDLESALNLLLRDDIVSWYHSRSNARSDSKTQEIERQLGDRIVRNCSLVRGRYAHCSPNPDSGRSETAPIDTKVRSLVAVATSSELLCRMPLNYQGWL